MSGKQIQHLYRRTAGGFVVYDRTEVIDVAHAELKTEILHLVLESPPKVDEPIIGEEHKTFYGVLPDWFALV